MGLFLAIAASAQADAESVAGGLTCPKQDGFVGGPYVATKDTAAEIYATIGKAMFPGTFQNLQKKYPKVTVEDQGDKWGVTQTREQPPQTRGTDGQGREFIIVQAGGGMLDMTIDKCTGAVSEMYFAR